MVKIIYKNGEATIAKKYRHPLSGVADEFYIVDKNVVYEIEDLYQHVCSWAQGEITLIVNDYKYTSDGNFWLDENQGYTENDEVLEEIISNI